MFYFAIPATFGAVEEIKAELTRTLPDVKSSHRCEALARGLGYNTYASLLSSSKSAPRDPEVEARAFTDYLKEHGFNVPPLPFYRATVRVAMRDVMERVPRLTNFGIGTFDHSSSELEFREKRAELLSDSAVEPFLLSLTFLRRLDPTRGVNKDISSYGLKHLAEKFACAFPDGTPLGPQYVPNGVLIAAAVHAGFDMRTTKDQRGREGPNAYFNISKRSLRQVGG